MLSRLLCVFASILAFGNASISDCGSGKSLFKITDLSLVPDPPVRGKLLDMTVKFENPGPELSDGTVKTSVSLNYIPLQPSVEDLCVNTHCPISIGLNDRSASNEWPNTVSGIVSSKIEWNALDGTPLLCIQINTKIAETASNKTTTPKLRGTTINDVFKLNAPVPYDIQAAFLASIGWE